MSKIGSLNIALVSLALTLLGVTPLKADGTEPFVGQIMWVPYNFVPTGWTSCEVALPNMQGALLLHAGQGSGLSNYDNGASGGSSTVALLESEMPAHRHLLTVSEAEANQTSPEGNYYAMPANTNLYGGNGTASMAPAALANAGASMPHNNMMPYTALHCIIALQGYFP